MLVDLLDAMCPLKRPKKKFVVNETFTRPLVVICRHSIAVDRTLSDGQPKQIQQVTFAFTQVECRVKQSPPGLRIHWKCKQAMGETASSETHSITGELLPSWTCRLQMSLRVGLSSSSLTILRLQKASKVSGWKSALVCLKRAW